MADDDQSLPTEFDSRFRSVYNPPSPIPGQDTPLYSRVNISKNDTLLERFGGLPTEGPSEAFYTPPVEGKGGTLVEASKPKSSLSDKKIREGKYELTPVDMNVAPQSVKEVLFGYDKPVGRYQTWPERLARIVGKGAFDIVGGIPAGVTAPRDAFTGKLQVTNPETGMPTEEAVQRSIEALSVPFKAGAIGVAGVAGPKLGSGPIREFNNKIQKVESNPDYVYHATSAERADDIAESGKLNTYKPHEFTDQSTWPDGRIEKRNYFVNQAEHAWKFAPEEGKPVLLRVKKEDHPFKREITGDIYSNKPVDASKIEYLNSDNKWISLKSDSSKPAQAVTAISDLYKNKYLPNGVEKPEAFDRVLPAVRNLETGKISTTKRGNEHADILTRLWEKEGGSPNADTMSIYEDMLPRHEMGYYDPLKKQFHPRDSEEWKNIDSPDLNPRQAMRSGMVFSDTQKPAQLLSSLTAAQRKAYNREAFRNGGQLLVPEASEEAINRLVNEPAYKKWDKAATDAGFTTDAYHGTENFEGNKVGTKREFYSTNEPKLAEDYGKNILPLKLNTSNYNTIDAKGKTWDQVNEEAIKAAKAEGKSGVTIHNLRDSAADREVEPATVHITFDPSTVRSRFAKFNPDDIKKNGLLLSDSSKPAGAVSAMANAPRFYSAVENAVNNIRQAKMPADQMLATLNNSRGVKPEEMDWLGLKEHLQSKGKEPVTKQEIQDFVNQNKVDLKEVNKGGYINWTQKDSERLDELERLGYRITDEQEAERQALITRENAATTEEGNSGTPQNLTKYSSYQLPGGENYREKLLTLPTKKLDSEAFAKQFYDNWVKRGDDPEWEQLSKAKQEHWIMAADETNMIGKAPGNYQSSHWDEPNVLAHIRMNDRNIEGKKSLHLEEIQSDWHQQGREKGYNIPYKGRLPEAINKDIRNVIEEIERREAHNVKSFEDIPKAYERQPELKAKYDALREELRIADEAMQTGPIPNAPFKKTWHELALKRMIREAAEKGYDRLSWTPGEAQAERYDLSKQVSEVHYNKSREILTAYDHNGNTVMVHDNVKPEKIADYVGKEAAEKLFKEGKEEQTFTTSTGKRLPVSELDNPIAAKTYKKVGYKLNDEESYRLKGQQLKVGGEGMKGFYDQIIPKALEKISGQKVKTGEINGNKYHLTGNGPWTIRDKDGGYIADFNNKEKAISRLATFNEGNKVHYIDIPQSLKDQALGKGFPLFSHTGHILTPSSNPNINNENDVPYGAGASNTPSGYPVHIDKRIPQYDEKLKLPSGEPADLHSYLQVHEITEHQLMKRGMSYEQAHKRATENEKRAVKRDGLDWSTYEHIMDGYLKETEHEKVANPPHNLYLKPYPHDKQVLLKKLENK